ncbi:MAG: tRNA pseudouridine(55) synthase TruB [Patescibacteria group bacterium]
MENSGFLLIDKPSGMTSHDVIDAVRRVTGERRVGHAGTLDPFATGLLIVGVGKSATTRLSEFVGLDKEYEATFVLGSTSTTDDPEGTIITTGAINGLTPSDLSSAMQSFVGTIEQIPPQYAAIKIKGKKMYELARQGEVIEAKPRTVTVHSFELREIASSAVLPPRKNTLDLPVSLNVHLRVSSGTYIRAIARDLGAKLDVGGYVSQLRRTSIGPYRVEDADTIDQLQHSDWTKKLQNLGVDQRPTS